MAIDYFLTRTTDDDQSNPEVARLKNGNLVLVWQDWPLDPSGFGVYGSILDQDLRILRPDIRIPQQTSDSQVGGQVTALKDGGFAVAWTSTGPSKRSGIDDDWADSYLRIFNADGSARTAEIQLTPQQSNDNMLMDVATLGDGSILSVVAHRQSGANYDLIGYRYTAAGQRIGGPVTLVDDTDQGGEGYYGFNKPNPEIAVGANGYALAWNGKIDGDSGLVGRSIHFQTFKNNGTSAGPERIVFVDRSDSFLYQTDPHVTALSGGRYAVTWNRTTDGDDSYEIDTALRVLDASGRALTGVIRVNGGNTAGEQSVGDVIDIGGGKLLVTYFAINRAESTSSHDYFDLMGRIFTTKGQAVTGAVRMGQYTLEDMGDGNAVLADDGSVIVVREAEVLDDIDADIVGTVFTWPLPAQNGDAGANRLVGTKLQDRMNGRSGADTILGDDGNDRLNGGNGGDRLSGGNGSDRLNGGAGSDRLSGGSGRDLLSGGTGNDVLTGNGGPDSFVFREGFDRDVITDFRDNADTIRLLDFGINSFAQARSYAIQSGDDVIFRFGDGDVLTIHDTTINALANDIAFV